MANIKNDKIVNDLKKEYEKIMLDKVKKMDLNMNVQNACQFFITAKQAAFNEVNIVKIYFKNYIF